MSTLQAFIHRIADKPFSETPISPSRTLMRWDRGAAGFRED